MRSDPVDTSNTMGWQDVSAALAAKLKQRVWQPGEKLPTEPELMAMFGVGRHSIRRAVGNLAEHGLVRIEQGRGTFAHDSDRLVYRLSERTRFSQNLLEQGREPVSQTIADAEIPAPNVVATALWLPAGEPVHHLTQLALADDVPLSLSNAYFSVRRFPDLRKAKRARRSTTAIYASYGVHDYVRLKTEIAVRLPTRKEASALAQPTALPVLVMRKVDADLSGVPIGYSESVWAGERVQFFVDNTPRLFADRSDPGGEAAR